uniref:Protein B4 n=1 Tax=Xenopus laevis TaxID=8355 RepID=B4_XENLA|nr:RecName: Full=Protein B4; AltName: Full=Histone H1-like protein; AltName: Full=Linker histone B4 [Xenopus laevis]AAA49739.1 histone H1-like maternal protein [Xenopus laevis]7KBF_K Chain K, Protein B4 [Xenopus laevis]CAA32067.1 unnamed protein product [Xenopus laevis]prf//2206324A histone B4 [Xenopus laevis]
MAPKKAVAAPEGGNKENAAVKGSSKVKVKRKSIKLVKTQSHPPTLSMVVEVLKKNTERKGTSVQAIRTRILSAHPTVDPLRLKFLLRTALNKGLEKGILIRPLNSSATGATGRFKLAKPVKTTKAGKENVASENVDPNAEQETQKKAPKKEKKAKTEKEPKGEKTKAVAKKAKEDSDEKPKVAKSKKDKEAKEVDKANKEAKEVDKANKEAKEVDKAPAKKPKAKTEAAKAEGGGKAKKEPPKAKAKDVKAQKDSTDEGAPVKAGKKGKKVTN